MGPRVDGQREFINGQLTFNNSQRTNQFTNTNGSLDMQGMAHQVVSELLHKPHHQFSSSGANNYLMPLQVQRPMHVRPPTYPMQMQQQPQRMEIYDNKENSNGINFPVQMKQSSQPTFSASLGAGQEIQDQPTESDSIEGRNQFLHSNPSLPTMTNIINKPPLQSIKYSQDTRDPDDS